MGRWLRLWSFTSKHGAKWRLTGFYSHLDTSKREETRALLESLGHSNTLPWLCLGDYNEILSQAEKAGRRLRPARQMDRFRMAISHCGFQDLGYRGSPLTWSRNRPTEGRIRIRLDRAFATAAWKSKFLGASVQHLSMSTSNHSMIAVSMPSTKPRYKRPRPPFRFEAMWLRDPHCAEIAEAAWMEGLYQPNGTQISNCLDSCRTCLSSWNKTKFGHVGRQITRLEKELQTLEQHHRPNHEHIEEVRKALNCWLDAENTMWHQKYRHLWITDGDRNTSFFHQKASNRKDRNFIRGITNHNEVWQEDDQAVERIVLDYFNSIFQSNGLTDTTLITAAIHPVVTDQMNEYLCQTFQADEVHRALKQMHPKKSSRPDGMPPLFYQHF
ncbi:hypothetical protein SO802_015724 [Lithocarpus litseifolius]|uniref:Endonuclease/exonuclease/phosphatase domain-containing protein n=1 Tax=Lithocarpus litseifolius TaxID=425828 RepID=A0AAW2CWU6_9ROSI